MKRVFELNLNRNSILLDISKLPAGDQRFFVVYLCIFVEPLFCLLSEKLYRKFSNLLVIIQVILVLDCIFDLLDKFFF